MVLVDIFDVLIKPPGSSHVISVRSPATHPKVTRSLLTYNCCSSYSISMIWAHREYRHHLRPQ